MISNGGYLFVMCGCCYYGFTAVNIFGPAPHFIVASATYAGRCCNNPKKPQPPHQSHQVCAQVARQIDTGRPGAMSSLQSEIRTVSKDWELARVCRSKC